MDQNPFDDDDDEKKDAKEDLGIKHPTLAEFRQARNSKRVPRKFPNPKLDKFADLKTKRSERKPLLDHDGLDRTKADSKLLENFGENLRKRPSNEDWLEEVGRERGFGIHNANPNEFVLTDEHKKLLEDNYWTVEEFLGLREETVEEDEIFFLRSLDLPRPPNLSAACWNTPAVITPKHRQMMFMRANGKSFKAIAATLGVSYFRVSQVLRSPFIANKVARMQETMFEKEAKRSMEVLLPKAFHVVDEILSDDGKKDSVRLDASKFVIEQNIGKAQQSVDVKSSSLAEFMKKLDHKATQVERDVDPVDDLVASFEPVSVGVRTVVSVESEDE